MLTTCSWCLGEAPTQEEQGVEVVAPHPVYREGPWCQGAGIAVLAAQEHLAQVGRPYLRAIWNRNNARTRGPWQRSRFVHHRRYSNWSPDEVAKAEAREKQIIRGPGIVGSASCNPVMRLEVLRDEDFEFVVHSAGDIDALLEYVARLERVLGRTGSGA